MTSVATVQLLDLADPPRVNAMHARESFDRSTTSVAPGCLLRYGHGGPVLGHLVRHRWDGQRLVAVFELDSDDALDGMPTSGSLGFDQATPGGWGSRTVTRERPDGALVATHYGRRISEVALTSRPARPDCRLLEVRRDREADRRRLLEMREAGVLDADGVARRRTGVIIGVGGKPPAR